MIRIFVDIHKIVNNYRQQRYNYKPPCVILTPKENLLILSLIHSAFLSDTPFSKRNKKILNCATVKLKEHLTNELSNIIVKNDSKIDLETLHKKIEQEEDKLFDELFPETISINN